MNPWEASARAAKAQRLVEAIDSVLPHVLVRTPESALASVEGMGDAGWASACSIAGVRQASAETRDVVVATYRRRVKAALDAKIASDVAGALIHFSRDAQGLDVLETGPAGPSCPCSRCHARTKAGDFRAAGGEK